MEQGKDLVDEGVLWELNRTKAQLSKRRKMIELLQSYNRIDKQKLYELTHKK